MIRSILDKIILWEFEQSESGEMRKVILNFLLTISAATCFIVTAINIFNGRPLSNILLPAGLGLLILLLYSLSKKEPFRYPVKLAFVLLISIIYVPVAWLTSPGSSSAMPMYTLLILTVTVLLIERAVEFLIPLALGLEILALLQYEAHYPERFLPYTDDFYHAFDLSVNFTAIAIILTILLTIVNHCFAREHQALYQLSITDQLTGTYNRHYMTRRLEHVHHTSSLSRKPYTVIMIDINNFKQVNDTRGHLEGDEVLRRLGAILKRVCRSMDIVVRYGGDEFLVILPNTAADTSETIANRIKEGFHEIALAYPEIPLDLAIGVAENTEDNLHALLLEVDNRLYHKKNAMKSGSL